MTEEKLAAGLTPRNIRLVLEYDGSPYHGWQVQAGCDTVEARVLQALERVLGKRMRLRVAGRTDAGVHALGQTASFHTDSQIPAQRFAPAVNAHLPDSIRVHRSDEVPRDFDARHSSRSKRYRYRLYEGYAMPPLLRRRAWHWKRPLDLEAMRRAASRLVGEHDFEAFRSTHCDAPHALRHMIGIDIARQPRLPMGSLLDMVFHANAFCRHMCRVLAGTLVEVGAGRRSPDSVTQTLESRRREQAGPTAPPGGLTLLEVIY